MQTGNMQNYGFNERNVELNSSVPNCHVILTPTQITTNYIL